MYAVIEQGSKQYRVTEGDRLDIELADVDLSANKMEIDKVLLVGDEKKVKIGTPYVKGAKVIGLFEETARGAIVQGKKLYPMHFRRRKNSKKRIGHRQKYLRVTIESIKV